MLGVRNCSLHQFANHSELPWRGHLCMCIYVVEYLFWYHVSSIPCSWDICPGYLVFKFFRIENIFPCKFHFAMVLFLVICSGRGGVHIRPAAKNEISLLTFLMFIYWLMWEGYQHIDLYDFIAYILCIHIVTYDMILCNSSASFITRLSTPTSAYAAGMRRRIPSQVASGQVSLAGVTAENGSKTLFNVEFLWRKVQLAASDWSLVFQT